MKKILLSKEIHPEAMALLKGKVELVVLPDSTMETAKKMVADVDGAILRTNIDFTRELIAATGKCKIISRTGVGVDNVDVAAATERGIMVCNTPGINAVSVAEQTLALMLGIAKQLPVMDKAVRAWCTDVVYIPTIGCMNLAATVNVVLYDRLAKAHKKAKPAD